MTETTSAPPAVRQPGLVARLIGVLFSPRETFAAVVARPRWLGAIAVAVVIIGAAQFALLSTDVGKQLALDQNISAMEAFGVTVSDDGNAPVVDCPTLLPA